MWIMLNDAMFSIVEDKDDETMLVVRARRGGDIEKVFNVHKDEVIETDTSDYRFRIWSDRDRVREVIADEVSRIDYTNFKNSVGDESLHDAYLNVWTAMFSMQNRLYPPKRLSGQGDWNEYLAKRYGHTRIYKPEILEET